MDETWQRAKCPQGVEAWTDQTNAWPVSNLILGSQTYGKPELLQILRATDEDARDASQILAARLIAAKLSTANGSNPLPVAAAIAKADALLSGFSGKLPYKVSPGSVTGQAMGEIGETLAAYDSGHLTPDCRRVDDDSRNNN